MSPVVRPSPRAPGSIGRAAAVLVAAAGVALAGCTQSTHSSGHAAGGGHSEGHAADSAAATVSGAEQRYAGLNLVQAYQRPSFTLTDTAGSPYDFPARTAGRPTLLFFGYTNCPDVCPTTLADVAVALRTVDPGLAAQVQVVFVTTDPARDTAAVLGGYLGRFDGDLPAPFVGLTGDQAQIDRAQGAAGVPLAEDDGKTHSSLLLLYGADDQAHVAFDAGNTSRDIAHDLELIAEGL